MRITLHDGPLDGQTIDVPDTVETIEHWDAPDELGRNIHTYARDKTTGRFVYIGQHRSAP